MTKRQEKKYFENHFEETFLDEEAFNIVDQIHATSESVIIDVGCGSGAWTKHLAERRNYVIGIDFSVSSLREMYRTLKGSNCAGIAADVEFLPLRDDSADECFFGWVLHHVPNMCLCLKEATRCLRNHGSMVLIEPNGSNHVRALTHHIGILLNKIRKKRVSTYTERPLKVDEVCRILTGFGFTTQVFPCYATERAIVRISPFSFVSRTYVLILKLTSLFFPGILGAPDFILFAIR